MSLREKGDRKRGQTPFFLFLLKKGVCPLFLSPHFFRLLRRLAPRKNMESSNFGTKPNIKKEILH